MAKEARGEGRGRWRCTGFVIEVGPPGLPHAGAFALARRVVGRLLPGRWRVEPLAPGVNDFHVTRRSRRPVAIARAFELAARLAADPDVTRAEPALVGPGLEPDPRARWALLAPHERQAMRAPGRRKALACAEDPFWSLDLVRAEEAWRMPPPPGGSRQGEGIVVAHPDTGYTEHPEIWPAAPSARRVLAERGYDLQRGGAGALDPLRPPFGGHGRAPRAF